MHTKTSAKEDKDMLTVEKTCMICLLAAEFVWLKKKVKKFPPITAVEVEETQGNIFVFHKGEFLIYPTQNLCLVFGQLNMWLVKLNLRNI